MKELERIEQKLNEKNIKLKGTIYLDVIKNNYIKIYDMHLTTFKKSLIGAYLVDNDKLVLM